MLLLTLSRLCLVRILLPNLDLATDLTEPPDFLEAGFIILTLLEARDFFVEKVSACFGEGLMIMLVPKVSVLSLLLRDDFFDLEYFEPDLCRFTGSSNEFCLKVGPLFIIYIHQNRFLHMALH